MHCARVLAFFCLTVFAQLAVAGGAADRQVFSTDWERGIPGNLSVQSASRDDLDVSNDPADPSRQALRASIGVGENYSGVANGAPRAEVAFLGALRFAAGHEYLVRWSTFIPASYGADDDESVVVTQIHQGDCCSGPPPVMLTIRGMHYEFAVRGGPGKAREQRLSAIDADIGRWTTWQLRYRPDPSGGRARTELSKNGAVVFTAPGAANAWPDGQTSYLKMGLYKTRWVPKPGRPKRITLFYGPVSITETASGAHADRKRER